MARPKLGEGETQRLQMKISDEELTAIDDWRFANRIPSRSEAVRRIVQIGLEADANIGRIWKMIDDRSPADADELIRIAKKLKDGTNEDRAAVAWRELMEAHISMIERNSELRAALNEIHLKAEAYRDPEDLDEVKAKVREIADSFVHLREIVGRRRKVSDQ